ncbi:MAG: hypothetical protein V1673_00270 [Candidatus Omnitrophota bacterium]
MSKTFKLIMAGLVAGTFLLEAPPAHAIFGIRAARTAIAARRAEKALSSSEAGTTTPGEENQSPEDLRRPEQESKNT